MSPSSINEKIEQDVREARENMLAQLKVKILTDYSAVKAIVERYEVVLEKKRSAIQTAGDYSPTRLNQLLKEIDEGFDKHLVHETGQKWNIKYNYTNVPIFNAQREVVITFWKDYFLKTELGIERTILTMQIPQSEVYKIVEKLEKINERYNHIIQRNKLYKPDEPQPKIVKLKIILEA